MAIDGGGCLSIDCRRVFIAAWLEKLRLCLTEQVCR